MPTNRPSSSSSSTPSLKGEKKRKHLPPPSPPPTKDGTRLQLDDILGTLSEPTPKKQHSSGGGARASKKLKKDKPGGAAGGVSALGLLLDDVGGTTSLRDALKKYKIKGPASSKSGALISGGSRTLQAETGDDKLRSKKEKKHPTDLSDTTASLPRPQSNASTSTHRNKPDGDVADDGVGSKKRKHQPNPIEPSAPQASPNPDSSPRTPSPISTSQPPPASTRTSTNSSASTLISTTTTAMDIPHQLKTLKNHLRMLITTLSTLESELVLVERVWYKNASQFKSALWWGGFDAVRRSLRRLLPMARGTVMRVSDVYGGLIAADSTRVEGERGWGSIPKSTVKPSLQTVAEFLTHPGGRQGILEAVKRLEKAERLLEVVKGRAEGAGKLLVTHLNTPPAPTFAPLVTTLVALLASVHSEVAKGGEGTVRGIVRLLEGLEGPNRDAGSSNTSRL